MTSIDYPLIDYLRKGISAKQARQLLVKNNCFNFPQLKSGLFPAAIFDDPKKDKTGMTDAWLRDTACIGIMLLKSGEHTIAGHTTRGVINKLSESRKAFEDAIKNKLGSKKIVRQAVRYSGQESVPRYDWANAQNDALGYALQLIGLAASSHIIKLNKADITTIDLIVDYLEAISYWKDTDSGHWEEVQKVNASSIGTVVGGLRSIKNFNVNQSKVKALIYNGSAVLKETLPYESLTPGHERKDDASLIFLVEPQHVIKGKLAEKIILSAEKNLMGERGFRRYNGDSYWGPDYRQHFLINERAADFSNPKKMEDRNKYIMSGNEAQWTIIDPLISAYYCRRFQKSKNSQDATKAQLFMVRSMKNIITHLNTETNEQTWKMPELFFLEEGHLVPNDHLGLLWGQANLMYSLKVYEDTFSSSLIKI